MNDAKRVLRAVPHKQVEIDDGFWKPRIDVNRSVTLPLEHELCEKTGRLNAWRWEPGQPNEPHVFWDSDVAKWVEAVAYSLAKENDAELERKTDEYISMMIAAQSPDGYLNSHFLRVEPKGRWKNLTLNHELYCAGHLMEAAVAYAESTGKTEMLEALRRYADHIWDTFGTAAGKRRGCPGHPEIELALVKLYRATGERRYLNLAEYFVSERGRQPNFFAEEAKTNGESIPMYESCAYKYCQAHKPVKHQESVEGHAVRALYLYSGMVDVAAEIGDEELMNACRRLWTNFTTRRMYVTGGAGSNPHGEIFTCDYDLPNETAYAETCAAIAVVFFAHRMARAERDARFADVMERALYNGVLSGVGLDGKHFFYANPLSATPEMNEFLPEHRKTERQEWFGCSCCPPNVARLLASLGGYAYLADADSIYVNLYIGGSADIELGEAKVGLNVNTRYPWDGQIAIKVSLDNSADFALRLRIPEWTDNPSLEVGGVSADIAPIMENGYAVLKRKWSDGDEIRLNLPMTPRLLKAHPGVRQDAGKVALTRGPLVYCFEEADNAPDLDSILLPPDARFAETSAVGLPEGVVALECDCLKRFESGWDTRLYRDIRDIDTKLERFTATAIPYHLWSNRGSGAMRVWLTSAPSVPE